MIRLRLPFLSKEITLPRCQRNLTKETILKGHGAPAFLLVIVIQSIETVEHASMLATVITVPRLILTFTLLRNFFLPTRFLSLRPFYRRFCGVILIERDQPFALRLRDSLANRRSILIIKS